MCHQTHNLFKLSFWTIGDVGQQGDKGPIGKAIEGPVGDQGNQGTVCEACVFIDLIYTVAICHGLVLSHYNGGKEKLFSVFK